jgi:hypothetical protein
MHINPEYKMRKNIGILLLCFWIPTVLGMAFESDGWYTIAGLLMMVFGTWGGILLVTGKK